jgi:hypothetical protein
MKLKSLMLDVFALFSFLSILLFGCAVPPAQWKIVVPRQGISYDTLWQRIVDTLTDEFDIEVIEKDSGYLRTSWKHHTEFLSQYRHRITVKVMRDPLKVKVKVQRQQYFNEAWQDWGTDEKLEKEILEELKGRIGL